MHPAIFYFNEVDSTNNEAKKLIEKENIKYGLVVSNYQSKGRGRFGNKWISQRGNFFSSFFFPVNNYSQVSQIQFEALKLVPHESCLAKSGRACFFQKETRSRCFRQI